MIHPGPSAIDPGAAPDGIVLRCYSVPDQRLLFEQQLNGNLSDDDVEELANQGVETAGEHGATNVCLVAYDGDSGQRIPLRDWFGAVPS